MAEKVAAIAQLNRLRAQLEAAVAARNWAQVAACDRAIAGLLEKPAAAHPALRPALDSLRRTHQEALAAAAAECARLADQLGHLNANRDGLQAYGQWLSEET